MEKRQNTFSLNSFLDPVQLYHIQWPIFLEIALNQSFSTLTIGDEPCLISDPLLSKKKFAAEPILAHPHNILS